jgi:hypothetical protein
VDVTRRVMRVTALLIAVGSVPVLAMDPEPTRLAGLAPAGQTSQTTQASEPADHRFDRGTVTLLARATATNWLGSIQTEQTVSYAPREEAGAKVLDTRIVEARTTKGRRGTERAGTITVTAGGQVVPSKEDLMLAATALGISPGQHQALKRGETVTGKFPLRVGPGQIFMADAVLRQRATDPAGRMEIHVDATSGAPWNLKLVSRAILDPTGLPLKGHAKASLDMGGLLGVTDVDGTVEQVPTK